MADTLTVISIGSFVAAGVFLVIAIVLFIVFRIPSVLGDLSGRNAKKSIEKMRKNNEMTRNKPHSPGITNVKRGKAAETGILGNTTEILSDVNETAALSRAASDADGKEQEMVFEYIENVVFIHTEEVI